MLRSRKQPTTTNSNATATANGHPQLVEPNSRDGPIAALPSTAAEAEAETIGRSGSVRKAIDEDSAPTRLQKVKGNRANVHGAANNELRVSFLLAVTSHNDLHYC